MINHFDHHGRHQGPGGRGLGSPRRQRQLASHRLRRTGAAYRAHCRARLKASCSRPARSRRGISDIVPTFGMANTSPGVRALKADLVNISIDGQRRSPGGNALQAEKAGIDMLLLLPPGPIAACCQCLVRWPGQAQPSCQPPPATVSSHLPSPRGAAPADAQFTLPNTRWTPVATRRASAPAEDVLRVGLGLAGDLTRCKPKRRPGRIVLDQGVDPVHAASASATRYGRAPADANRATAVLTTAPGRLDNPPLNTVDVCPVGALTSRTPASRCAPGPATPSVCNAARLAASRSPRGRIYRLVPRENPGVNRSGGATRALQYKERTRWLAALVDGLLSRDCAGDRGREAAGRARGDRGAAGWCCRRHSNETTTCSPAWRAVRHRPSTGWTPEAPERPTVLRDADVNPNRGRAATPGPATRRPALE
jgi:hypothetical protein